MPCSCICQADQASFQEWQKQMAVDRSRGHFFKSLYQAEPDPDGKLSLRDPQASIREKASPRQCRTNLACGACLILRSTHDTHAERDRSLCAS